jgi:hypothetical protein
LGEFATFSDFAEEIRRIVSESNERKIILRIMGGAAIRMHCPEHEDLYERLKRTPKHDMDFVTYSKFRPLTRKLFVDLGYEPYISLMMTGQAGRLRQIFNDKEGNRAIDVFLDKLKMCHEIEFQNRLEIDTPTVPLAELLLQKLQIVETNEKDIQDAIILIREHEIGDTDKEQVNGDYIASILCNEWGFCYTVTQNLARVAEFARGYGNLTAEDKEVVTQRINKLQQVIDQAPKALRWKMRAKAGRSVKWYNVVEEVQRS